MKRYIPDEDSELFIEDHQILTTIHYDNDISVMFGIPDPGKTEYFIAINQDEDYIAFDSPKQMVKMLQDIIDELEQDLIINYAQEQTLRKLCKGYKVDYDPTHYHSKDLSLPEGYVSGWIGGSPGTIYVGVAPDGSASS